MGEGGLTGRAAAFIPLMLFVHINFDIPLKRQTVRVRIADFAISPRRKARRHRRTER